MRTLLPRHLLELPASVKLCHRDHNTPKRVWVRLSYVVATKTIPNSKKLSLLRLAVRCAGAAGIVHLFRRHKQSSSRKLSARVVSRACGREPTIAEARRTCSEYGRMERSTRDVRARIVAPRHRDRRQFCAHVLREQRASAAAAAETRCVVIMLLLLHAYAPTARHICYANVTTQPHLFGVLCDRL